MQPELELLTQKCQSWQTAAQAMTSKMEQLSTATGGMSRARAGVLNGALIAEERTLLADGGIPGRPWFRHLIYAPLPSYDAETLPGLREALVAHDMERALAQSRELGKAIDRATAVLKGNRIVENSGKASAYTELSHQSR